jgi:hypothetical protein
MSEPSPASPTKGHHLWPYVAAGILLAGILGPIAFLYQDSMRPDQIGFILEPVSSPQQFPDRPVVDLTRENASKLPGDIPTTLERAKTFGRAETGVDRAYEMDELLQAFGVDTSHPGWHYTLIRYEDTVYSYGMQGV